MDLENGFEDVSKSRRSKIWNHFYFNRVTEYAQCIHCFKKLKAKYGSSKGLNDHVKAIHGIVIKNDETPSTPPTKQAKISGHYQPIKRMTLETKVSRLCTLSCLTFNKLAHDKDIREALKAHGFELPKSCTQLRKLVLMKHDQVIEETKVELEGFKEKKIRGSLTTDEYTSIRNRRFVNINFHTHGDFHSLGIARAKGTMPAEKQAELLTERLAKYDLVLSHDIIAMTTDGASVMKKMGRALKEDFGIEHIICNAHTLHLVVGDVFYRAKSVSTNQEVNTNNDDSDLESDDEDEGNFEVLSDNVQDATVVLREDIKNLIMKVRKVVKLFKRSPVKNDDALQVHVFQSEGKEKQLVLDCKTRWNTVLKMLERFFELKKPIEHALVDIDEKIDFTDAEFSLMSDIIKALEPINLAVLNLCSRNATLVTAEKTYEIVLKTLEEANSELSSELSDILIRRIIKRRNTEMIHLMQYLDNPSFITKYKTDAFGMKINPTNIRQKAISLIKRLYPSSEMNESLEQNETEERQLTLKDKFAAAFERDDFSEHVNKDSTKALKLEMTAFELSGKRSETLENLYQAMCTIPPTSVEPERAFSTVGLFATKMRSSLADNTIDAMLTLRTYFMKQEKLEK